jgi:tetratricopeptide (TPR) repeat protein
MGVVYRARHETTGATVALKTVRAEDASLMRGIRREIHALRRARHAGVVSIVDEGVEEGMPWYAMELIEGRTLREHLRDWWRNADPVAPSSHDRPTVVDSAARPESETTTPDRSGERERPSVTAAFSAPRTAANGHLVEALTFVRGLCSALAYLHGEGIVHRDLKPDNVMIRDDGTPVLVDFGLVAGHGGATGRESLEFAGALEGSFSYMAPEQGTGQLLDARADLYALGCILYEIATGTLPFSGAAYTVLRQHVVAHPEPPSVRARDVPFDLEALILRLLSKAPSDRLGFASDVGAILATLGATDPLAAHETPTKAYLYRPEFAGRKDVLEGLEAALAGTLRGEGRLCLIGGESGAGKTRLAAELATLANTRGMRVFTGECVPIERSGEGGVRGVALSPLRTLLEAIADHCRAGDAAERARVLGDHATLLATYDPSFATLAATSGEPALPELPPDAARHRLFFALSEALSAFATLRPMLLVLDDLQWADELTTTLLATLARQRVRDVPVMILGTYREEETTDAIRELRTLGTDVRLDRLDAATISTMAARMLALGSLPPSVAQFLADRSSGNPFFVAEYLRAAVGVGLLTRRRGEWSLELAADGAGDLEARLPLPRSLGELVRSRLDGLDARARALLEVAAVLGREVPTDMLAALSGLRDTDELEASDQLVSRRVLDVTGDGNLRFAHDKLREITYDAIDAERRRTLHGQAARVLEARSRTGRAFAIPLAELGHHFLESGDVDRAISYFAAAGERAHRMAAYGDAAVHLARALSLDPSAQRTSLEQRTRWERLVADALYATGKLSRSEEHAARALTLAGRAPPTSKAGWARALAREIAVQASHRWLPRRTIATPTALDAARAAGVMAECIYWRQDSLPMTTCTLMAVNLAETTGEPGEVRREYAKLAYLVGLGRMHGVARRYFDRANAAPTNDGPTRAAVAYAHFIESMYHVVFARWDDARTSSDRALEIYRALGDPQQIEITETMRVQADFYCGRFEDTLPRYADVRRSAQARGNKLHDAWGAYGATRSLIPLGRLHDAISLAREALALLHGLGDRVSEMTTHGLLAHALLLRGDLAGARASADKVAELAVGTQPTVFSEGAGYEGAAIVALHAWEAAGSGKRRFSASPEEAAARTAVANMSRFARIFPHGRAPGLRLEGTLASLSGDARLAVRRWTTSIEAAKRANMPYDAALARVELARRSALSRAERLTHWQAAADTFEGLDCRSRADECEAERRKLAGLGPMPVGQGKTGMLPVACPLFLSKRHRLGAPRLAICCTAP